MPRRRPTDPAQMDLLAWQPEKVVRRFAAEMIRAASQAARLCRGLKVSLKECGMTRAQVAERMGAYLGEPVSEDVLNAYVGEAKAKHIINAVRLVAFIAATGDHRPLNALLDDLGLVVVEKRYLPWIEVGILREKRERIDRDIDFARRRATQGMLHD